jgi:predicted O-methyltransferase YrrM
MSTLNLPPKAYHLDWIESLYRKHRDSLARVRTERMAHHRAAGNLPELKPGGLAQLGAVMKRAAYYLGHGALMKPQLDDLEAEVTFLLLREFVPREVVEISPCGGWSSTWILSALRDNQQGRLTSFDLVDLSTKNVPAELAQGRWDFVQGDATRNLNRLPAKIDYLFIDSDHSAKFARWYIDELFSRLASGTPVSVHDVFHTAEPAGFDEEGGVLISWLEQRGIPYMTLSPKRAPDAAARVRSVKSELGLDARIHRADNNSMVFFRAP